MPVCANCESNEFDLTNGLYSCSNCNAVCEDFVEENAYDNLADSIFSGSTTFRTEVRISTGRKIKQSRVIDYGKNWTTYEAFNIILRQQVDALISLGVSEMLKPIVLHLWTKYLENLGIAKLDDDDESGGKMKCKTYMRNSDRQFFLNGAATSRPQTRPKLQVIRRSKGRQSKKLSKRRLRMSGYTKRPSKRQMLDVFAALSRDVDDSCGTSELGYLSDTSTAALSIQETDDSGTEEASVEAEKPLSLADILSKEGRRLTNMQPEKFRSDVRYMRLSKTLCFLYLGLLLLRSKVLLSDLIRVTWNGQVPFRDAAFTCLPASMKFQLTDTSIFRVVAKYLHGEVRAWTSDLADYLAITKLPDKPLEEIATRMLVDFDLPECLNELVGNLMSSYPTRTTCAKGKLKHLKLLPNYEGRAAAYIVMVLKMLFSLDGVNEWRLDKYCDELQREHLIKHFGPQPPFKWNSWMTLTMTKQAITNGTIHRGLRDSSDCRLFRNDQAADFYRGEGYKWSGKYSQLTHYSKRSGVPEEILKSLERPPSGRPPAPHLAATSFPFTSEYRETVDRLPGCQTLRSKTMAKNFRSTSVAYIVNSMGYRSTTNCSGSVSDFDFQRLRRLRAKYADCFDLTREYGTVKFKGESYSGLIGSQLKRHLSHSMYWLVCLFASFLEMTPTEMYDEIVIVEKEIHRLGRKV